MKNLHKINALPTLTDGELSALAWAVKYGFYRPASFKIKNGRLYHLNELVIKLWNITMTLDEWIKDGKPYPLEFLAKIKVSG
jgi:hypothetical protein